MFVAAAFVLAASAWTSLTRIQGSERGGDVASLAELDGGDTATASYDADSIVSAHLFGDPRRTEPRQVERAPETKLKLRLMGMIASANDDYARALIGVNTRNVGAYGVGDTVDGTDARIRSVEPRRVLLERGGALESLYLRMPSLSGDKTGELNKVSGAGDAKARSDAAWTQSPDTGAMPSERDQPDASPEAPNEIRYGGVREETGKRSKLPF